MSVENYKNWQDLPLNEAELAEAAQISAALAQVHKDSAYLSESKKPLQIAFKKATLTLDETEWKTGAWRRFTDGQPFYQVELKAVLEKNEAGESGPCANVLVQMYVRRRENTSLDIDKGDITMEIEFRDVSILRKGAVVVENIERMARCIESARNDQKPTP